MTRPAPARVLLIGMMGAGKSTVGRELAARTGWPYLDNDDLVHRARGLTAPEVLARDGVEELRAAEADALTLALGMPAPVVAGVAGGVVLDAALRARLVGAGVVVWLRARPQTLAVRVGRGEGRPWLEGDPVAALRRLAAERDPLYAEVATLVVDVDGVSASTVAARVLAALPD